MNRLKTDEATLTVGQPILPLSVKFIQDGIQEAITNLVNGLIGGYTTGNVIIWNGVVITISGGGNTATWTAGSIFYNNEVYTVQAGTVNKTGGQTFVFTNTESYDNTIDPTFFEDDSQHYPHKIRQIQIVAGTSGGSGVTNYICDYNDPVVIQLNTKLIQPSSTITNLTMANSYTAASGGVGGSGFAQYSIDIWGKVKLIGAVYSPASVTSPVFATLPAGARPSNPKVFPVGSWTNQQNNCVLYIAPNGECRLYDGSGANVTANKTFWIDSGQFIINT